MGSGHSYLLGMNFDPATYGTEKKKKMYFPTEITEIMLLDEGSWIVDIAEL
jgi:hypothetical protein